MDVLYRAIKTKNKNGRYSYGIEISRCYSDVFESEKEADEFAEICNRQGLSALHFDEVIDDYLNR